MPGFFGAFVAERLHFWAAMTLSFRFLLSAMLIFGLGAFASNDASAKSCRAIFAVNSGRNANLFHQKAYAEIALKIMMKGSLNVSRTKVLGRRFIAPEQVADNQIAVIAEANFQKTAQFVLENFERLDMNLETATILNKMLTEGLVPENIRGQYDYRTHGSYTREIDRNIGY